MTNNYTNNLKYDLLAGVSVFLVAIPLCLGIALACGAPLISGLFAGIIGGILIGILSDSHLSVSGPAAGLVAIVITGISDMGFAGFCTALVLAGGIQIVLGVCRAGKLTEYLPYSVIEGMMAAIGIILIIKQFPILLGKDLAHSHNSTILALGIFSLIFLFFWDKYFSSRFKLIPGSLVVVILGTLISLVLGMNFVDLAIEQKFFVQIPSLSTWSQFTETLTFPNWTVFNDPLLYKTALVVALVASIESLLCINAIETQDPYKRPTNKNRELIAQGTGNLFSGLIGGLPITSVIVRSSVNLNAGARTKLSAIFHGFLIIIALIFGAKLINSVPLVSLAAILIFTGYKLAHPSHLVTAWKKSKIDLIAFVATVIMVVKIDLLVGVLSGIAIFYILTAILKQKKS